MPKLTLVVERTPLKVYDLNATVMTIGRDETMDVVIDNVAVSRRQAEIRLHGGGWVVDDLGSGNGTFVNGRRVDGRAPIKAGDEISFGKYSVFFDHVPAEPIAAPTAARPAGVQAGGTVVLNGSELAELRKTVEQKRLAQLRWRTGGTEGTYYLTGPCAVVGRSELCELQVPMRGPKQHILVTREGSSFEVRNLSRWYRMRVNGVAQARAVLRSGDRIDVGGVRLTFLDAVR